MHIEDISESPKNNKKTHNCDDMEFTFKSNVVEIEYVNRNPAILALKEKNLLKNDLNKNDIINDKNDFRELDNRKHYYINVNL